MKNFDCQWLRLRNAGDRAVLLVKDSDGVAVLKVDEMRQLARWLAEAADELEASNHA